MANRFITTITVTHSEEGEAPATHTVQVQGRTEVPKPPEGNKHLSESAVAGIATAVFLPKLGMSTLFYVFCRHRFKGRSGNDTTQVAPSPSFVRPAGEPNTTSAPTAPPTRHYRWG
ncbi:hypothetical protein DL769_009641 [Monosporascus sp. CRB-8-3]|nr:hypothetical protein DL769_009641 [Monosporascus sp. CRB-8-3]